MAASSSAVSGLAGAALASRPALSTSTRLTDRTFPLHRPCRPEAECSVELFLECLGPCRLYQGRPGVGEEPADDEEPGEERQDHLHDVPPGLAAEGPERDRLRAHRVDRPVQRPGDQRQQPHGALLLQHRRGARPLPLAPARHLPVLAVAGDVAPGPVHRAHLRPDRFQGQDRGLLPEVKRLIELHRPRAAAASNLAACIGL